MVREKLRDRRGFTIIELVAVIAILLIIMAIAMPSITSLLGRTENKISNEKKKAFISAAREYVNDNYNSVKLDSDNKCKITLQDLNNKGYLSDNSYKDTDGNPYSGYILYTYSNGLNDTYTYNSGSDSTTC